MERTWVLYLCAMHSFAFAAFHAGFWRLFGWPDALARSGAPTRAITQILNLRLIHVFAGIGLLCCLYPDELAGTPLGRAVLALMATFWIARTIEQFVFVRIDHPLVHVLTASFVLGAALFAWPLLA